MAIDAATCRDEWTYNWELKGAVLSPTNRGVAMKDGRLVRGTADGYLIALDMAKGTLLWSQKIADAKTSQYLSMPPLIYEDLVIYGPAGADWGAKNWIGAFRLNYRRAGLALQSHSRCRRTGSRHLARSGGA